MHSVFVTTEISVGLVKNISVINYVQNYIKYYSKLDYKQSEPDKYISKLFALLVNRVLYFFVSKYISFVRPS